MVNFDQCWIVRRVQELKAIVTRSLKLQDDHFCDIYHARIYRWASINGVYHLTSDESWYDRETSAKISALAATDNAISQEFVERVFKNHEFGFVRQVLVRAGVKFPIDLFGESPNRISE